MTMPSPLPEFDGQTYSRPQDHARLGRQLLSVFNLMKDGQPRMLAQIAQHVGGSEASVSARLRDLRKSKFGGYDVERKRIAGGLWSYALKLQNPATAS